MNLNTKSTILVHCIVCNAGNWLSLFELTTSQDTSVLFEWTFNPIATLPSVQLVFGQVDGFGGAYVGLAEIFNLTGDVAFVSFLATG